VHLVDASDPDAEAQQTAVERILSERGLAETPRIVVLNKIDRLEPEDRARLLENPGRQNALPVVAISANDRETSKPLLELIENTLWHEGRLTRARPAWEQPAGDDTDDGAGDDPGEPAAAPDA